MADERTRRVPTRTLLDATSVEARIVGLTRVHDDDLDTHALGRLLLDRAPRVREQARRRGLDLPAFYREHLTPDAPPRVVAACLDGLGQVGDAGDMDAFVYGLGHESTRVRATAVAVLATRAEPEAAVELLAPRLLDPAARVATAAARALATLRAPAQLADEAWTAEDPANRRAAWRLTRSAGGWERVRADLRAAADPDSRLSGLGRAGISNWLAVHAATAWNAPTSSQDRDIETLLDAAGLDDHQRRFVAFSAGIKTAPRMHRPNNAHVNDDAPAGAASQTARGVPSWPTS